MARDERLKAALKAALHISSGVINEKYTTTADLAYEYNILQGNKDFCLLEETSVITGVE